MFFKKFTSIASILFIVGGAIPSFAFESAEHVFLGDEIKLIFVNGQKVAPYHFHLNSGLVASYGDIITLGDFYEIVNQPISQAKNEAEGKELFLRAFHSFAENPVNKDEATTILNIIHDEQKVLQQGLQQGKTVQDIYHEIGTSVAQKLNCATGGGCHGFWWLKPGRLFKLELTEFDHFGENAVKAYKIGHEVAIQQAIKAHANFDRRGLEIAYAMNAFASHFLSDRYSTGHMRTPRPELVTKADSHHVASFLSHYMHSEESKYGLHVHNKAGDQWPAYGDKSYLDPKTAQHREQLRLVLQRSVYEIFAAFLLGRPVNLTDLEKNLPVPNETGAATIMDIAPLFYWDEAHHQLMRRSNTSNVHDAHWQSDWHAWTTLLRLTKERGLPFGLQIKLAHSSLAKKAVDDGLITDKEILHSLKSTSVTK